MSKWLCFVLAVCASLFPAQAANVGYDFSLYTIPVGMNIPLDVVFSGRPVGLAVGAFDLTLQFDPSRLSYVDFTLGPYLGDPVLEAVTAVTQIGPGLIEATVVSLLTAADLEALQASDFRLGTLLLNVTAVGTSNVTIGGVLSDASGGPLNVSFGGTTVIGAAAVPEPGTVPLLVSALAAIAAVARLRRARET